MRNFTRKIYPASTIIKIIAISAITALALIAAALLIAPATASAAGCANEYYNYMEFIRASGI